MLKKFWNFTGLYCLQGRFDHGVRREMETPFPRDIAISCGEPAAAFIATETGRTVAPLINAFSGLKREG